MTGAPRLIAIGDNCLDVYLARGRMAVGGNALNVAAWWQRNGFDTRYFGTIGPDLEGDALLAALSLVGLDPADVERRQGNTAVTLLLERDGDRRFLLEDLGVGADYIPDAPRMAALEGAAWVHLGTNAAPALVRRLVLDGVPFSVDVSTAHDCVPVEGVPLVFASGPEEVEVPVAPILRGFRDRGARRTILTCGRRGAMLDDGSAVHAVPANEIAVIDTCGAGDSFIAAFIAAEVIGGASVPQALAAATQAAATTCGHEGGFPQPMQPIPAWLLDKYAEVIGRAGL